MSRSFCVTNSKGLRILGHNTKMKRYATRKIILTKKKFLSQNFEPLFLKFVNFALFACFVHVTC